MSAACSDTSGAMPTCKNGPSLNPDGWMGGIFGGYNFQSGGMFVAGLEGDITFSGSSDKASGIRVENDWNGTVRARAGVAVDRFLIYGTGGLAVGSLTVKNGGNERQRNSRGLDDRRRHRSGLHQQHHRPARVPLHRPGQPQLRYGAQDQCRLPVRARSWWASATSSKLSSSDQVSEAPLRRGFLF